MMDQANLHHTENREVEPVLSLADRDSSSSSSWVNLWNTNYSSPAGLLNLDDGGSAGDLTLALGDKAVAAKAVAFVVSSTRKGIVAHCADIANLLRTKQNLEDRITQLISENEALRRYVTEMRGSITDSTVTHSRRSGSLIEKSESICSHQSQSAAETRADNQCKCRTIVTSPDGEVIKLNDPGRSSSTQDRGFLPVSPAEKSPSPNDVVHPIPSVASEVSHVPVVSKAAGSSEGRRHPSKCSSVSISSSEHSSNRSMEHPSFMSQESWQATMQEQLNKTIIINNRLSEELHAARLTISNLQKERSVLKGSNHSRVQMGSHKSSSSREASSPDSGCPSSRKSNPESSEMSDMSARCERCTEMSAGSANGTKLRLLQHNSLKFYTSDQTAVCVGDNVLTCSSVAGAVKYIGHLPGISPTCLFVGLQLAQKVDGGLDGTYGGKRYFTCPKGKGIFVNAQDIITVIMKNSSNQKKTQSAAASAQSPAASSSSSGGSGNLVRKLRKAVTPVSLRHTQSEKRISLPSVPPYATTSVTSPTTSLTMRRSTSEDISNGVISAGITTGTEDSSLTDHHLQQQSVLSNEPESGSHLPEGLV